MIVAVGDKRVPNAKSAGQVAHQRRKEIISGCRSGADDNGTKSILRKMPIRDVADQTDYTDHLPLSVAMRSKSAGLPQIATVGRMLGYQSIRNLNNLSSQRSLQRRFYAARNQPGEHFGRDPAQYFLRALTREPLHEGIEELVAQFRVIDNDAFGRSLNDLPIKLHGFTQRKFVLLLFSNIP